MRRGSRRMLSTLHKACGNSSDVELAWNKPASNMARWSFAELKKQVSNVQPLD